MPITAKSRIGLPVTLIMLAGMLSMGCSNSKKPTALNLPPRYPTLPPKQVPAFLKDTVYERCELTNNQPYVVSSFGLVANLRGTGDTYSSTAVREFIRKEMINHLFGSSLLPEYQKTAPEEILKDPRFAIVRVDALIPPGARKHQRMDAFVSTIPGNNTSSLAHGVLYRTDLKVDGANPVQPGYQVNVWSVAEGPIFINPSYALIDSPTDAQARLSLKNGLVMNGAACTDDRPLTLMLRQPELRLSRAIEIRINQAFQTNLVASAKDEGIVSLLVPERFNGDWEHFAKVVMHLYLNSSPDFAILKARQLVDEAKKPDAYLEEISYCWEGLGPTIVPIIAPLLSNEKPEIAYAAARASAFLGDSTAQSALMNMAREGDNPFQIPAVQTLAKLPNSPLISSLLHSLLDSDQSLVRIEAYRALAAANDSSIFSQSIGDKFMLDIVQCDGPPLVYASRIGVPRIAVFGDRPTVDMPIVFTAMQNRFSISSQTNRELLDVFYRGTELREPVSVISSRSVDELIGRLGGEGAPGEVRLQFNYCDVVAIMQSLCDQKRLSATAHGRRMQVAFKLQDPPRLEQTIEESPMIGQPPAASGDKPAPGTLGSAATSGTNMAKDVR